MTVNHIDNHPLYKNIAVCPNAEEKLEAVETLVLHNQHILLAIPKRVLGIHPRSQTPQGREPADGTWHALSVDRLPVWHVSLQCCRSGLSNQTSMCIVLIPTFFLVSHDHVSHAKQSKPPCDDTCRNCSPSWSADNIDLVLGKRWGASSVGHKTCPTHPLVHLWSDLEGQSVRWRSSLSSSPWEP